MSLYITDHALLRYIERVHGVEVEILREKMRDMALRGAEAAESIGGGSYTINCSGVRMRVVGRNVVTVLTPKEKA